MCGGRKNRAIRHQQMNILHNSLLAGATPLMGNLRDSGFNPRVDAVSNPAMKPNHILPQYSNQVPVYPDDYKFYNPTSMEQPPAYERLLEQETPDIVIREVSHDTHNTGDVQRRSSQPMELPPQYQTGSPQISKLVDILTTALAAYQSGVGRRKHVRRAQKTLRNELYREEISRRQSLYGKLRCGERSEIWREVKAINFG